MSDSLCQAILTSVTRSYVPDNLASDSYALKVVKTDIQDELTQARARIKKAVRSFFLKKFQSINFISIYPITDQR